MAITNIKQISKLSIMTLAIFNVISVVSLRGLPAEAEYGLSSAFYYIIGAIFFLIPTALVAAELAAMFQDKEGGVFRWVGEAFGKQFGFLAIWLQWIETIFWFVTVLIFGAVCLAFIGMDSIRDASVSNNKIYILFIGVALMWIITFISLKGSAWVSKFARIGGLTGTIIPTILLVILAIIYLSVGGKSEMDFHADFFPDLNKFDNLVLAISVFLYFAGMEISGLRIKELKNPVRDYPRAVFLGSLFIVLIFVSGTYALGIIIPQKDISLTQSVLVGFDNYFRFLRVHWLSPIIAIALTFGVLASVLIWAVGPSKGIFAVGKAGYLPPFFQKTNKVGAEKNILIVQAIAVSLISILFVVMPSVESFYQILCQLTILLHLLMYLLMFAAAIYLRYSLKEAARPFRIGKKGNLLLWIVAGGGFIASFFAFLVSFIPPGQIETGSHAVWYIIMSMGCVIFVAAPFIIYALRKPQWKSNDADSGFKPFHWEETNKEKQT